MTNGFEIAVIDDDEGARDSMCSLLLAAGYTPRPYASAKLFLEHVDPTTACVIVDLEMPEMGGLELQAALRCSNIHLPIIFVTGYGDISLAVQALKAGAADFIEKPFLSKSVLDSLARALETGQQSSDDFAKAKDAKMMLALLTPREHGVMNLLVKGCSTKVAAYELGISPRTVETYRARIMNKTSARNIADVVRVFMTAA